MTPLLRRSTVTALTLGSLIVFSGRTWSQETPAGGDRFVPAIELLPDSVAGLVRVPDLPAFCEAFEETNIGQLLDDEAMQPFLEAQRARAKSLLESLDNRVGVTAKDLYEVASGEVVFAWLPFEKQKKRPFSLVVIADVRDRGQAATAAFAKIDKDLVAGGWTRSEREHRGETMRVYGIKPKPGQLKINQIAMVLTDERLIAVDRESVLRELLDGVAGDPPERALRDSELFRTVLRRSSRALVETDQIKDGVIAAEWFARPFQMARIVRDSLEIDRKTKVDIINLLSGQGFDAIEALGGVAVMSAENYDLLLKAFVYAPPVTEEPSKYEKAAKMMQFPLETLTEPPRWMDVEASTLTRLNVKIEEAFWAMEGLIDEALGEEGLFETMFDGIKNDEQGPQIDIPGDVIPNLDDHFLVMTESTKPIGLQSQRLLTAIRVKDADVVREAIGKAMNVDLDAKRIDVVPGVELWQIQRDGQSVDDDDFDDLEAELYGDLDIGGEQIEEEPLLNRWAIGLIPAGPGSPHPYVVFSSHPELLIKTAKYFATPPAPGFADLPIVAKLTESVRQLGGEKVSMVRFVRTRLSVEARYELLRQEKLKDSDSIASAIVRRIIEENDDEGEQLEIEVEKLPEFGEIADHFPDGGSFLETRDDGWMFTGFFLK